MTTKQPALGRYLSRSTCTHSRRKCGRGPMGVANGAAMCLRECGEHETSLAIVEPIVNVFGIWRQTPRLQWTAVSCSVHINRPALVPAIAGASAAGVPGGLCGPAPAMQWAPSMSLVWATCVS